MDTRPVTRDARRRPEPARHRLNPLMVAVLFGLAASLVSVSVAPFVMPEGYSWVEHSVSESAAQGLDHAWVSRFGFLLLAFAVLLLSRLAAPRWGRWGRMLHSVYGISMVGVAAFSHLPWQDMPGDRFEDLLHSIFAFSVGASFVAGVLVVSARRPPPIYLGRLFDWAAVIAAIAISLAMNYFDMDGLAQRVMFLIGYAWYGSEAVRSARPIHR